MRVKYYSPRQRVQDPNDMALEGDIDKAFIGGC